MWKDDGKDISYEKNGNKMNVNATESESFNINSKFKKYLVEGNASSSAG